MQRDLLFLLTMLVLGAALVLGFNKAEGEDPLAAKPLIVPPEQLKHFTFGYQESVADSLWIRVIQDIDHCESAAAGSQPTSPAPAPVPFLESQLPGVGLVAKPTQVSRCSRGWVFHMMRAISELAPRFRSPYAIGAPVLSVLVDDRDGASEMFERGLKHFPDDWPLAYRAAYHALYELNDYERAAQLLIQAGRNGAPQWVYALAARLYTDVGRAALGKSVLEDVLQLNPDGPAAERIRERLKQIDEVLAKAPADGSGH